jgi:hypothetical protein
MKWCATLALAVAALLAAAPAGAVDTPPDWTPPPLEQIPNFRDQTREVVLQLAAYAKKRNPGFVVLMRGGIELLVKGEVEAQWDDIQDPKGINFTRRLPVGARMRPLVKALDGLVLNGLYCGPDRLEKPLAELIKARLELDAQMAAERKQGITRQPTPTPMGPFSIDPKEELRRAAEVRAQIRHGEHLRRLLYAVDAMTSEGRPLYSLEACPNPAAADAAFRDGHRDKVDSFAVVGDGRLDQIPRTRPHHENATAVSSVIAAHNWLPILKSDRFGSRAEWMMAMQETNYDMVVVDIAHHGADPLNKDDVYRLKFKKVGQRRLVLAELPIGRAFDWRLYWQKGWEAGNPPFLFAVDDQPGTFITDTASGEWRQILGKYITYAMDLGFDGVMLDDVDTYLWFEDLMPLGR